MSQQLHKAQGAILHALRHSEAARFSALMRLTNMQSDTFKFHVQKLLKLGYLEKTDAGVYKLTPAGKEFANNLNDERSMTQRQPKLSLLLIVPKTGRHAEPVYLFQERRRNPFFGFWSCIGGPIQWGESAEKAAARELKKQTGLVAECVVRSFCRQRDFSAETHALLEGKLFIVLEAMNVSGELQNDWYAGRNQWMTLTAFKKHLHYFSSVPAAIELIKTGEPYIARETIYEVDEY